MFGDMIKLTTIVFVFSLLKIFHMRMVFSSEKWISIVTVVFSCDDAGD